MSIVRKESGRFIVKMNRAIRWAVEVMLPEVCPECDTPLDGFDTHEEAIGRILYDGEGVPTGGDMAEYFDDPLHRVKCNACGEELAEGRIFTPETHDAIAAAEALAAVIDDAHTEETSTEGSKA